MHCTLYNDITLLYKYSDNTLILERYNMLQVIIIVIHTCTGVHGVFVIVILLHVYIRDRFMS